MNTARFLKYVWPFYNIMHERVKLFDNSWDNSCSSFVILYVKFHFACVKCKVRKCYDQDWRCETVLMPQSRGLFLSGRENLVENEKFLIGVVVGFIKFLFRCIRIKWKHRNNGTQRRRIGVKLLPDAPSVDKHWWKTSIFFRIALAPSLQK